MSAKIKLYVPEGRVRSIAVPLAPRLQELQGKVIAFMQNGKPNADVLLGRLAALMQKEYGLAGIITRAKAKTTEPAEFIEALSRESQGVVNAIGD